MKKKWIIAAGTCAAFLLSGSAFAASFIDVPTSHWAYPAIEWTYQSKLMGPIGRSDLFIPARVVSRGELSVVIARLYNKFHIENAALEKRVWELERQVRKLTGTGASSSSMTSSSSLSSSASSVIMRFSAILSGSREVPSVTTNASGSGTFTLTGRNLNYDITVKNLSGPIMSAHFHRGVAGVAGPVVMPIAFSGSRAFGTWSGLTNQELAHLLAGRIYVNVHTPANPNGEIRGQVLSR